VYDLAGVYLLCAVCVKLRVSKAQRKALRP
jgi:hypothetical protein